ncbi:MAG: hypothetical protein LC799_31000 [Actinobacteria bacterium]|nr:hypothetical protein [Actinomycetota bacterium]
MAGTIEGVPRRSATDTGWLVVDTSIGVAVEAGRAGWWIGRTFARTLRPLRDLAARPPLVPERYRPADLLGGLAAEGHDRRDAAIQAGRYFAQRSVPVLAAEVLDQLDLTELIRERIDHIGLAATWQQGSTIPGASASPPARWSPRR